MGNKKKKYNKIAATGNVGRQPDTAGVKTIILTQPRTGEYRYRRLYDSLKSG